MHILQIVIVETYTEPLDRTTSGYNVLTNPGIRMISLSHPVDYYSGNMHRSFRSSRSAAWKHVQMMQIHENDLGDLYNSDLICPTCEMLQWSTWNNARKPSILGMRAFSSPSVYSLSFRYWSGSSRAVFGRRCTNCGDRGRRGGA